MGDGLWLVLANLQIVEHPAATEFFNFTRLSVVRRDGGPSSSLQKMQINVRG